MQNTHDEQNTDLAVATPPQAADTPIAEAGGQDNPSVVEAPPEKSNLPGWALACSSVAAVIYLLSLVSVIFLFIAYVFWPILLVPVGGMIMGIMALCQGEERIGAKGIAYSALAIILPIASVLGVLLADRMGAYSFSM